MEAVLADVLCDVEVFDETPVYILPPDWPGSGLLKHPLLFEPIGRDWLARQMLRCSLFHKLQDLNSNPDTWHEATRLFYWLLESHKPSKPFQQYQEFSRSLHGVRESISGSSHWLNACPQAQCSLCLFHSGAESANTPRVRQRKIKSVMCYPLDGNGEPIYLEKAKHEFIVYPNATDRAKAEDYSPTEDLLHQFETVLKHRQAFPTSIWRKGQNADTWTLKAKTPEFYSVGGGYEAISLRTTHFGQLVSQTLWVPSGSVFVRHGEKDSSAVVKYPDGFAEPVGGPIGKGGLWEKLSQIDGIEPFDRENPDFRNPSEVECLSYELSEYPRLQITVKNGVLYGKKKSQEKPQRIEVNASLPLPTFSDSPEHFQKCAFSHLSADDCLGGGIVAAKSQAARYRFDEAASVTKLVGTKSISVLKKRKADDSGRPVLDVKDFYEPEPWRASETTLSKNTGGHKFPYSCSSHFEVCTDRIDQKPLRVGKDSGAKPFIADKKGNQRTGPFLAIGGIKDGCEMCPTDPDGRSIFDEPTSEEWNEWNLKVNRAIGGKLCPSCNGLLHEASEDLFICDGCGFKRENTSDQEESEPEVTSSPGHSRSVEIASEDENQSAELAEQDGSADSLDRDDREEFLSEIETISAKGPYLQNGFQPAKKRKSRRSLKRPWTQVLALIDEYGTEKHLDPIETESVRFQAHCVFQLQMTDDETAGWYDERCLAKRDDDPKRTRGAVKQAINRFLTWVATRPSPRGRHTGKYWTNLPVPSRGSVRSAGISRSYDGFTVYSRTRSLRY